MADPDLQIRGGGHLDPEIREGGGLKKNFLGVWSKNKGGAPFPGSATVNSRGDFHIIKGWGCFSSSHLRHLSKILVPGDLWCSISSRLTPKLHWGGGVGVKRKNGKIFYMIFAAPSRKYLLLGISLYNLAGAHQIGFFDYICYSITPLRSQAASKVLEYF